VAEQVGRVAGREGDDVGAGDDAGAGGLERVLDRVDELEAAQARVVGRALLLRRRAERGRVQKDGSITALVNHETSLAYLTLSEYIASVLYNIQICSLICPNYNLAHSDMSKMIKYIPRRSSRGRASG
jgi:hypothetical protein